MSTRQPESRAVRAGRSAGGLTALLRSDVFLSGIWGRDCAGMPASEVIRTLAEARDILVEVASEKVDA